MKTDIEELTQTIIRDLQIENVTILQAVLVTSVSLDNEFIWCECIDDDELEDQQDVVASAANQPELARKAYQAKPTLFYVKIEEINNKLKATLMTSQDIKVAKQLSAAKQIQIKKLF